MTVYTTEMDPSLVLSYAARMGVELADVREPHKPADPEDPILWDWPEEPGDLLLDSLSSLGREVEALRDLKHQCEKHHIRALIIAHETKKKDDVRGSGEIAYECDLEIRVTREAGYHLADVVKNRFGACFSIPFMLGGQGVDFPEWDRYYSIEGDGGRFSVRPFPSSNASYADPFRYPAELGRSLPPPPLAVAAQYAPLYPGKWVEPSDNGERRAFAARLGLPYWSPHGNPGPA